jgi:hypothetical protein
MRKKKGKALYLSSFASFEDTVGAAGCGHAANTISSSLHQPQRFSQAPQITYKSE